MAVTLITGSPGAGKTLSAIKMLVEDLLPTGREIYADIEGLDYKGLGVCPLVAEGADPVEAARDWYKLPDGSIIIIDECQRIFPVRNPASKVPEYISQFETHRHHGFDIVLITQGPRLIDRHLHDLVGRHIHLFRAFGLKRSTKYDWNGVNLSPDPTQSKDNAQVANFVFPKKYFDHYKSASVHTVKARLPWKPIIMILISLPIVLFCFYLLFARFVGSPAVAQSGPTSSGSSPPVPSVTGLVHETSGCRLRVVAHAFGSAIFQDRRTGELLPSSGNFTLVADHDSYYAVGIRDGRRHLICP